MDNFHFIQSLKDWSDQYPWIEMLTGFCILIVVAILAYIIAKHVVVRGIRHLITKLKFANHDIMSQHSVIR